MTPPARAASVSGDPLGSLAMSLVTPRATTLALRARTWQRDLERLGVVVPFVFVHDVGLLLAASREQVAVGPRCDQERLLGGHERRAELIDGYREFIEAFSGSDASRRSHDVGLTDTVVAALLARVLGPVAKHMSPGSPLAAALPAQAGAYQLSGAELAQRWSKGDRRFEIDALRALTRVRSFVLMLVDALDVDTLRLLGVLGQPEAAGASFAQLDLLSALGDPGAHDIVSFSLDLVPSVLETRSRPGAASQAAFGYSGVGRKGSLDSLVLTELAWDGDELARRLADDEVLYFLRDQAREEARRRHVLLIDASASMRGDRSTFARGLALATAKKLVMTGDEVLFRFFDARLYEPTRVRGHELPTAHVLSFRGERGRNPIRVFGALAAELAMGAGRDGAETIVHLFTHGAHDVPRGLVAQVRQYARLSAVFVAPQGGAVDLDYLDLLDAHWVVSRDSIADRQGRLALGRAILRGESPGGRP